MRQCVEWNVVLYSLAVAGNSRYSYSDIWQYYGTVSTYVTEISRCSIDASVKQFTACYVYGHTLTAADVDRGALFSLSIFIMISVHCRAT